MRRLGLANAAKGLAVLAGLLGLLGFPTCPTFLGGPFLTILAPLEGQLSPLGELDLVLRADAELEPGSLRLWLDGAPLDPASLEPYRGKLLRGPLGNPGPGWHQVRAQARVRLGAQLAFVEADASFELASFDRPEQCDPLNQVECVLPFPSSRFLEPAPTETGFRVVYPEGSLPEVARLPEGVGGIAVSAPLSPEPFLQNDGFSPTVQMLMHFSAIPDLAASNAPRLLPETRTFDEATSLADDAPTVLIDLDTGERVLHFLENDARDSLPGRKATFLRPGRSLTPGHRYAVAVRKLVDGAGDAIPAEPFFAAVRDRRPVIAPDLMERSFEVGSLLARLEELGVPRDGLQLAFDFVVMSDRSLSFQLLSMRDQALAHVAGRLAAAESDPGARPFVVDEVVEVNPSCADPDVPVWRDVRGRFEVPLFLSSDPFLEPKLLGTLVTDADGNPVPNGTTWAPFGVAIPCTFFDTGVPRTPLVVGHGLFGTGPSTVSGISQAEGLGALDYVAGGTNWSGLSSSDINPSVTDSFIFNIFADFDDFGALPARLRQGTTNTLVLTRLMDLGAFNADPAFQNEGGVGALDAEATPVYFGASLGGIMGGALAATTGDIVRMNLDVPAINFSILLQRATPFAQFEFLLTILAPDPMIQALGIGLLHEQWVRGESACCATHVTRNPLPGSVEKQILMTVALHDQQVTNLGAQVAGATMGLPNLLGSVSPMRPGLPDEAGPLPSAYVVYDTGSFDPTDPRQDRFIPPLANRQPATSRCDPHGLRGFIPASIDQLLLFLDQGRIENFCSDDGICNASEPNEIPFGLDEPCQPEVRGD